MKVLLRSMLVVFTTFSLFLLTDCQKKMSQAVTKPTNTNAEGISETDIAKDLSMLLASYLPSNDYFVLIELDKKNHPFYEFKTFSKSSKEVNFNPSAKRLCQGIEQDFNECVATLLKKEGCAKIYKENDFQYFACDCK